MRVLIISRWDKIYENKRSRELQKLRAVQITNSWESERYHDLLGEPKSAAIFAAWVLMLQVASTCTPRGALLRDNGKPHDAQSLAIKTHAPAAWFRAAIPYLTANGTHHEPGWLAEIEVETLPELGAHGCFFPPTVATQWPPAPPISAPKIGTHPPKIRAENRHPPAEKGPPSVGLDSVGLDSLSQSGEREGGDDPDGSTFQPPRRTPSIIVSPEAIAREKAKPLPKPLEVPAFRKAREDWIDHILARSRGALSFQVIDRHDALFAQWGAAMAIAAIDHSIKRLLNEPQLPRELTTSSITPTTGANHRQNPPVRPGANGRAYAQTSSYAGV